MLPETVGLVGLGEMGLPMAVNVLRGGAAVVGFDVDDGRRAAAAAAGVRVAASCAEVAEAGTVIVMVRTLPQVEEVLLGPSGLLASPRPAATLVLVMSTIDPRAMERVAAGAAERGATVVDAPVSGGVKGAEAGTLAVMAAGDPAAFERVRPLLDVLGGTVRYLGERPGLGQAAKLVNQLLMTVSLAGAVEGLALAARYGLERERLLEVLRAGTGSTWVLEHWDWMCSLWEGYRPGNALDVLTKDMRALFRELEDLSHGSPVTAAAFHRLLAFWEPYLSGSA